MPTEKGDQVDSSEFTRFGHQWRLLLYPGGRSDSTDGMVAAYLHHFSNEPISIQWCMSVHTVAKKELTYKFGGRAGRGWKNFCKRSDMVDALVDGTLVVEIKLKVAESL